MGKTTVWKAALAAAASRSYRVLAARPSEAETQLAYAALGDLLVDVADAALAQLPGPQRHALEVALLRAEPEGRESLQRAIALGTLGVLRALQAEGPILVAIDDAQWLDPPSESALAFAARRLGDDRVGLLVSRRLEGARGIPLDLDPLPRIRVEPLDVAAIEELLATRLGTSLPRRTLVQLHRASRGNPFFALEIGRALRERGDGPQDELPIPPSLQDLVRERLGRLPPASREAVEVAAALSRPTPALVEAATDAGGAVDAAVDAGIFELDGERIRFDHPLLASIAYAQIPLDRQRALHARLAEVLDDPEERARHLALAAERPDAAVADLLDEAAGRAGARGAPDAAAELLGQARRLTPPEERDERRRRGIEAAERRFEAGDIAQARGLLDEVIAETPPGCSRALALARLGWVRANREGMHAGAEVFRAALDEPTDDVALRIEIEQGLAWCVHSTDGVAAAMPHARTALELAEDHGDPTILAGALGFVAFLETLQGRGIAMGTIERALALGHSPDWSQILGRPDWLHALMVAWTGDLTAARERFAALHREALERGDEQSLAAILVQLARAELLTGDWDAARLHAAECHEATVQSGQVGERPYALVIEALVAAHFGDAEKARATIEEGLELAERLGTRPAGIELLATRGFLELSRGDAAAADCTLARVAETADEMGIVEPVLYRFHGDAIEAKVALGATDEATALVDALEALGARLERAWALAIAARGRGLLSAALGDRDAAYAALDRARELHDRLQEPFERARTLLALGSVQRRDRKKQPARESLEAALAVFDDLGAALWSERARAELARIGGRAPAGGLTPTEARVAELIAAGRTYREAADALFISPKTVQWNLSKIYRKLGIRSRAELAARLAREDSTPNASAGVTPADRPVPR